MDPLDGPTEHKRTRKSNFTEKEIEILAEEVKKNGDILFNSLSCGNNSEKKKVWGVICDRVNENSDIFRTVEEVRKKWQDYRCHVKKKAREYREAKLNDDGNPPEPLTDLEKRVAETIPEDEPIGPSRKKSSNVSPASTPAKRPTPRQQKKKKVLSFEDELLRLKRMKMEELRDFHSEVVEVQSRKADALERIAKLLESIDKKLMKQEPGHMGSPMGPHHMGPGNMGSGHMGPPHMGPGNIGPGHIGPGNMGSGNMGSGNMGPGNMGSGNMGSGNMGTGNMGSGNMGNYCLPPGIKM